MPITEDELWFTLKDMVKGKTPRPNGVIVEFFLCKWSVIGKKYMKMIQKSIVNGSFPLGVTRGLITILHKGGEKKQLSNWRPITLFNVMYKVLRRHSGCECNQC